MQGCSQDVSPAAGLQFSIAQWFWFMVGSTTREVPPACASQRVLGSEGREKQDLANVEPTRV